MRFAATSIPEVLVLEPERHVDERGYFVRTWCGRELAERGLEQRLAQCSASFNPRRGTLRGLHYQAPPRAEVKIVRCIRGAAWDVAVDLRPGSPTLFRWIAVELSPENGRALYIPRGFAHGFLTMQDGTELAYQISEEYSPAHARGARWDDPALAIRWPAPVDLMSERDRGYPDVEVAHLEELRGL